MTFTVVTHNIPPSLDWEGSLEALNKVADVGDIIALQEATHLRGALTGKVFDAYWPEEDAKSHLPILWRTSKFDCIGQGSDRVYPEDRDVHLEPGAGPDYQRPEWFNWVVLLNLEFDEVVSVINVHPVPSIAGNPIRTELHKKLVERVSFFGWFKLWSYTGHKHPVLAMGDWNCEPDKPNMQTLVMVPWQCDTLGTPTHGNRSIDDVYRLGVAIQPVRQWTFATGSDHKAAAVEYSI